LPDGIPAVRSGFLLRHPLPELPHAALAEKSCVQPAASKP
jgi:hypothetical protein